MLCAGCHNFLGNPCPSCRTVSRLKFLLESSELPVAVETKILTALRQAAGEISDVIEQHGTYKPRRREATPKPETKEESTGSKEGAKEEEEDPARKKEREARREERRKRKAETADRAGVEETPGGSTGVEETPEEGKKKRPVREEEEDTTIRGSATLEERVEESHKKDREEHLQTEIDSYVCDNPGTFGLGHITLRGSAARHFRDNDARRSERPAEPEGPPPIRRQERQRSRSKKQKKKSKGKAHRQRGRDYWKERRDARQG